VLVNLGILLIVMHVQTEALFAVFTSSAGNRDFRFLTPFRLIFLRMSYFLLALPECFLYVVKSNTSVLDE
jgi:hypothetical protein